MKRLTRTRLGPRFSEGARKLWDALGEGGQAGLAEVLGISGGHLSKILYGDTKPGRALGLTIQEKLGIGIELWGQEPGLFRLPAVTEALSVAREIIGRAPIKGLEI